MNMPGEFVRSLEQYKEKVASAKARFIRPVSNCFLFPWAIGSAADSGRIRSIETDTATVFLFQEEFLYRCYYYAKPGEKCDFGLCRMDRPVVSEEVYTQGKLVSEQTDAMLRANGFKQVSTVMHLIARVEGPITGVPEPEFAETEDLQDIRAFLLRFFDVRTNFIPTEIELRDALENRQVFVVRSEGKPVAVLYYEIQGQTLILRHIAVDPEARRHGLGRLLVDQLLSTAAQQGKKMISLWTRIDNSQAISVYSKAGFTDDNRRSTTYSRE